MRNGSSGRSAEASHFWVAKAASLERRAGGRSVGGPRPDSPSASECAEHDHQWLETWQRNEIRWLRNRVAELEHALRWRTITLGSALALGILAATGWAVALLYPDKPGLATLDPSVPFAPAPRGPVAGSGAEQAAPIAISPEDPTGTLRSQTASPSDAPVAAPAAEDVQQAPQPRAPPAERELEAMIELPAPEDAQQAAQLQATQAEPALDAMTELPAAEDARPAAQLRLLEAERVLDAMIEEAASGHQSTSPTSVPAD